MDENQVYNKISFNLSPHQIIKNPTPHQISVMIGKQIKNYLIKFLPIEITELPRKDDYYRTRNKQFVNRFCSKWIPRLYGVTDDYPQYRNACLCEFIRWHVAFGIPINYETAKNHWYWEPDRQGDVPDKLKIVAGFADIIYSILWGLGIRLQYRIQTF